MKTTINGPLALLCFTLAVGGGSVTNAQPTISDDVSVKYTSFVAGKITVKNNMFGIETKSFLCMAVPPVFATEEFPAMVSEDQAWSVHFAEHPLTVGLEPNVLSRGRYGKGFGWQYALSLAGCFAGQG